MNTIIQSPDTISHQEVINKALKRTIDVLFSLAVLILIFPWVYIVVAIAIKLSSKGPVFFVQPRTGLSNKEFDCYKFRSMRVNQYAHLMQAKKDDERKTKVGEFLRKSNIDELPQFWNVLKGDMSVVGPRPHMVKHTEQYSALISNYMDRHEIKPGITGLAQVRGYRGETNELHQMMGRVRLDVWYIQNWTMALDLSIVVKTIKNVVKGEKCAY